ncbi:phage holin [Lactobacillus sp. HT06-2]|uniref:phage holin n=1 Tax=Lactobacillus sp. HT06-2 TaxID=2080222 RepID=UPI000CD9E989|nr:phage holin [Lactobacillus sp. HT06-2]
MDNILIDAAAVVIAIVFSYAVFWYKNHKTVIDKKKSEGDALAFSLDVLGKLASVFAYDLKDSSDKGAAKKKEVTTKIKKTLGDAKLPVPNDDAISGAIEKAVTAMKVADGEEKSDKNA